MSVEVFYDRMASLYHLIYLDWPRSIERHARLLDAVIREHWGSAVSSVLDVACGIGTQTLGLAQLGYQVTASDLSPGAVQRAQIEAARRGLSISFSVADMREAFTHHRRSFDLVIACDNAVPHLLSDDDILAAFGQLYRCTRAGGGCLISVRDYAQVERKEQVLSYGVRQENGIRYLIFQAWRFHGKVYDLDMYFVEDSGGDTCTTHVMRTRYYAVHTDTLADLMQQAGFDEVQRLDDAFPQPLLIGTKRKKVHPSGGSTTEPQRTQRRGEEREELVGASVQECRRECECGCGKRALCDRPS